MERGRIGDRAERWVTLSVITAMNPGSEEYSAAIQAALARLTEFGIPVDPTLGRPNLGAIGFSDDDIRVDLSCGRLRAPSAYQVSVRKSALDAVLARTTCDQPPRPAGDSSRG
jgi:hypothetical protein